MFRFLQGILRFPVSPDAGASQCLSTDHRSPDSLVASRHSSHTPCRTLRSDSANLLFVTHCNIIWCSRFSLGSSLAIWNRFPQRPFLWNSHNIPSTPEVPSFPPSLQLPLPIATHLNASDSYMALYKSFTYLLTRVDNSTQVLSVSTAMQLSRKANFTRFDAIMTTKGRALTTHFSWLIIKPIHNDMILQRRNSK